MKVLVVDDEPDARALMKDLLLQAGHRVTSAASSVEAMVHAQMERFDLAIVDVMMPGMNGHELARFLSEHWATVDLPVLMVSCRKDGESHGFAKLNGCAGYLEKPFGPAEFLDAVASARLRAR